MLSGLVLQDHQHNRCRGFLSVNKSSVPPIQRRVVTCPNHSKHLSQECGDNFLEGQCIIQLFGVDSPPPSKWDYLLPALPQNTTAICTITNYFRSVTDFSQEGGRQQVDYPSQRQAFIFMETCLFKTQNLPGACGLLPFPKFSFAERPIHTYPLLSVFPNSPPTLASSFQVQVPGLSPSKTRQMFLNTHGWPCDSVPSDSAAHCVSLGLGPWAELSCV